MVNDENNSINFDIEISSQINNDNLGGLIAGMHDAYKSGANVMEYARHTAGVLANSPIATLIAYDLQAGSYIKGAKTNPEARKSWCDQLSDILSPLITNQTTILEVGCGEATTLAGMLKNLKTPPKQAFGFDISWSRCAHGLSWMAENSVFADLFVADIFEIPLDDSSIDIVYTSHSLEPNGGREEAAIKELMRVARQAVVLVEPLYELADSNAQERMRKHGYVRDLKNTAEALGAKVTDYRLLNYSGNPLNPSGLVLINKEFTNISDSPGIKWRCPLTLATLVPHDMGYYSPSTGIVYPVLGGIPLLRSNHAVVASSFSNFLNEFDAK